MIKKFFIFFLVSSVLFCTFFLLYKEKFLQELFINSTISNYKKVRNYENYLIEQNTDPTTKQINSVFFWDNEMSLSNWKYYNGILMKAFIMSNNRDFAEKFYYRNIKDDGSVNNDNNSFNVFYEGNLDSITPARTLFLLLDSPNAEKYKLNIKMIYNALQKHPTSSKIGNNYIHKINSELWNKYPFALDSTYAVYPFILEYDKYILGTENKKHSDDIFNKIQWIRKNLKNKEGLYNHGIMSDGKTTNNIVWLRGVGWYAMCQVDVLGLFPEGEQKEILKSNLKDFFDAMLLYQDKKTGMWHNVVYPYASDKKCNKLESSGSAMMAYALMNAYVNGYVSDKKYAYAGLKAFNGLVKNNLEKYRKNYCFFSDTYLYANVKNNIESYCNCNRYVYDEAKGIAPLIMASTLVNKTLEMLFPDDTKEKQYKNTKK